MNSQDLLHILDKKFPQLLTDEEKEDMDYKPNSCAIPDMPVNFREWYFSFGPQPEAL
jgi:hypothetical protein